MKLEEGDPSPSRLVTQLVFTAALATLVACSGTNATAQLGGGRRASVGGQAGSDDQAPSGGQVGGGEQAPAGGQVGSGGTAVNGGVAASSSKSGAGGIAGIGGTVSSGGSVGTAGQVGLGGSVGTGGTVTSGGKSAGGGKSGTGGIAGVGGTVKSGGSVGTAGQVGLGGSVGTGGTVRSGGSVGTAGQIGTGGSLGTGGQAGTGIPDDAVQLLKKLNISANLPSVDTAALTIGATDVSAACTGARSGAPAILCVSANAANASHKTIQSAIAASKSGDLIKVATGTYAEDVVFGSKAVRLQGGYSADFGTRVVNADLTHIQGTGKSSAVFIEGAAGALLDGFTISGGKGRSCSGGGIYVSGGRVTISGNVVRDNAVCSDTSRESQGGGIFATDGAKVQLLNNVVRDNVGGFGGGVMLDGCQALLADGEIYGNVAHADHGGGVILSGSESVVRNVAIHDNRADPPPGSPASGGGWGGGIIIIGGKAHLLDLRVSGNYAAVRGSAVDSDEGAWVLVEHSLIFKNHTNGCPEQGGAGAYVSGPASTLIVLNSTVAYNQCSGTEGGNGFYSNDEDNTCAVINSILWENRVSSTSPASEFAYGPSDNVKVVFTDSLQPIAGAGNLSKDPQFKDPGKSDFTLAPDNPLLGAGMPLSNYQAAPGGPITKIGW
jgi:hypothetical protein